MRGVRNATSRRKRVLPRRLFTVSQVVVRDTAWSESLLCRPRPSGENLRRNSTHWRTDRTEIRPESQAADPSASHSRAAANSRYSDLRGVDKGRAIDFHLCCTEAMATGPDVGSALSISCHGGAQCFGAGWRSATMEGVTFQAVGQWNP